MPGNAAFFQPLHESPCCCQPDFRFMSGRCLPSQKGCDALILPQQQAMNMDEDHLDSPCNLPGYAAGGAVYSSTLFTNSSDKHGVPLRALYRACHSAGMARLDGAVACSCPRWTSCSCWSSGLSWGAWRQVSPAALPSWTLQRCSQAQCLQRVTGTPCAAPVAASRQGLLTSGCH